MNLWDTSPSRRKLERLPAVCIARHHRRTHRVLAGQLHRAPAHRRKPPARLSLRRLLENVFHRHPTGCHSVPSGLLSRSHHKISQHFSRRRTRRPYRPDSSPRPHHRRLRRDRNSLLPDDQADRQESRKLVRHGRFPADRWHRDVGHRRDEGSVGKGWPGRCRKHYPHLENGRHEPRPIHLDRRLPDPFRGLSRNLALHGHDRRRDNSRECRAPPPSNSRSSFPCPP